MQKIEKTYVTYLPYIYRNGACYEVNAFTTIPRTKGEIFDLADNIGALKYIIGASQNSLEDLTFEVGQFVDSRFAKDKHLSGKPIDTNDRLVNINTISAWIDTEEDDKTHTQGKTFIVNAYKMLKTLDTLGVDISLKIDEETQELTAFVVHPDPILSQETTSKTIK